MPTFINVQRLRACKTLGPPPYPADERSMSGRWVCNDEGPTFSTDVGSGANETIDRLIDGSPADQKLKFVVPKARNVERVLAIRICA